MSHAIAFRPHGWPTPEQPLGGPQYRFLRSGARSIFFGGAAGPGKSICLCAAGARRLATPGYRGKIFRRTRKQATDLILKTNRLVRQAFPGVRYNGTEHAFVHPKGGRLEIGYLRNDMDLENEEGQEYSFVGFDEMCQFEQQQVKFLNSRLRSDQGLQLEMKGTGNPRGVGVVWVWEEYVKPAQEFEIHWREIQLPGGKRIQVSTQFIPGRLEDNPSLGEDYEVSLAALDNPRLYEALRWGKWDALMGDAFQEWDVEQHRISWADFAIMYGLVLRVRPNGEEYCEIPTNWPIFMSYDWGTAKPFSVGWWTADPYGRLTRIYEWYGCRRDHLGRAIPDTGLQMATRDQAIGILRHERDWGIEGRVELRVADSAIFNDRGVDTDGPTLAEIMAEEGVYMARADKRRVEGKNQFHDRLRVSDFLCNDGSIEETAGLFVMDTCKDWLRTVPMLPTDPKNPEDVDTKTEDHCLVGSTLVETEHGPVAIRDLVGTEGWVLSWDGDRCLRPYSDVRRTQRFVRVYRVTLDDGRTFSATANHRVLLTDGRWKRVDELSSLDVVRDAMMTPDTEGSQDGHDRKRYDPGLPGRPVLQVWTLLPAEGQAATPCRVGIAARAYSDRDARSPQGWRPDEQPTEQLGSNEPLIAPITAQAGTCVHRGYAEAHGRSDAAESCGVALIGGRAGLAQHACAEDLGGTGAVRRHLPNLRGDVQDTTPNPREVLPAELQGIRVAAASRASGSQDAPRVVAVDPAGYADVYNMEVAGSRCFAVNGGLVVHNCWDESRYMLMARPWKARLVKDESSWMRERGRRRSGHVA